MPVGRVEFLYLRPLSFSEYLEAAGYEKLRAFLI
jgi:predicted AAA+ superfamily ATPase